MDIITLLLLLANTGLVIYALIRINALYVELRTPIVKKLNPDMNLKSSNSRRPVGPQEMAARQGNNNRDNRNNSLNQNKDRQKDNRGDRPQQPVAQQPSQAAAQGEAPRGENRDRDRNRDGRRDDRNRDGRNRDGRRDDRNRDGRDRNRRPQEMMGNDVGAETATTDASAEAPVTERVVSEGRPSFEGRRPLEPRFQPEVSVATESVSESTAPVAVESEAPEFDPSKMRHGRRSMVKKSPAFEEDASTEAPNT